MTMAQRNAIQNPATGLMVYQMDNSKGFWFYDGIVWKNVTSSTSANGTGSDAQTLIYTTTGF